MAIQVTAPLVIAKNGAGGDVYVYTGGIVADQTDQWIQRHLDDRMVIEVNDAPDIEADAAETVDPITAFLDRNAKDIIDDVPTLTDEDRSAAAEAEMAGKARTTVLEALTAPATAEPGE